ncbi:DNA mismatch repair protein MutS [Christiangramia fulva]|uniref:DNA mismatch repair protein MutS n=1 Tax=Christiangramia fulva TaxID=2126553 RepID=A0A2R3Z4Q0_9FLAO|nr:DNA mismatch repair protein MutS [Christiangramia fulva]AVR45192.1 DNA mismatch repair protein MutS [Christiangramia fulva]
MKEATSFYNNRLKKYQSAHSKISRKLVISGMLRLLAFLLFCAAVYFFFGNLQVLLPAALVLIVLFIFLVSRHNDLKKEKEKLSELININEQELNILKTHDYSELTDGKEFEKEDHEYCRDIDLFGRKSFFQYLNRTALKEGKAKLAESLLENECDNILKKQEATRELSAKADWRQDFTATARLVRSETRSSTILDWLGNYQQFVPKIMAWIPGLFSVISVGVFLAFYFSIIPGLAVGLWLVIGIGITAIYLKKVNELSEKAGKTMDTFQQYHQLLALIEKEDFEAAYLKDFKESIQSEKEKASVLLKKFSRKIDSLDQRNNFLFGFLANGFFLWDLRYAYAIEKWIGNYSEIVEHWFEAVETLDAWNSLGNFDFNHQHYVYPEILSENKGIKAKKLGHPLLNPDKRVTNDFEINSEEFFIITGANMAGKSTFLRTVALQILMSNIGLPVCAESCQYSPIKLITSMRTSDSLGDDESYFFSELKRLKFIVDHIEKDQYFIILDEILKGTNSTDKAIGSKKFVQRLVKSGSTGIIATHDLSLCEISEELIAVKNFYFDAEILHNELHFDYQLKNGICKNMNASFLLRKMKIVDEEN